MEFPFKAFLEDLEVLINTDSGTADIEGCSQMAAFFDELFWDGRAKSLEEQALGPITDPKEMANTLENAQNAIKNATEYYPLFIAAFGDESKQGLWKKYFPQLFEQNATKGALSPSGGRATKPILHLQ